jgi:hypothetical protein
MYFNLLNENMDPVFHRFAQSTVSTLNIFVTKIILYII